MNPNKLVQRLYLGDRYCTRIVIDNINSNFELHLNSVYVMSNVELLEGRAKFNPTCDIENGAIVISQVERAIFDETGLALNDEIYDIIVKKVDINLYEFTINGCNVNERAEATDVTIKVYGKSVHLFNPQNN